MPRQDTHLPLTRLAAGRGIHVICKTHNPAPVLEDWGFDRPGHPRGLYLHGVTMPEKPLPNPVIYDKDEYADVLDDVLCAMASLGKLTLAAQVFTAIDSKGVFKQSWQDSAFQLQPSIADQVIVFYVSAIRHHPGGLSRQPPSASGVTG
jgi:hypothetical protein